MKYTIKQVSELMGVGTRTVYNWISEGLLKTSNISGDRKIYILEEDIKQMLNTDEDITKLYSTSDLAEVLGIDRHNLVVYYINTTKKLTTIKFKGTHYITKTEVQRFMNEEYRGGVKQCQ